jgi:PKD repeat protein
MNFGSGWVMFTGSTMTHTFPGPGNYMVVAQMNVYDSTTLVGCTDKDSQMVNIPYPPCAVSISSTQISNNTITFTANNLASTPGMSYNWNFGDGNTGTGSPVTHTYATSGYYHVTLTASSTSANCSSVDSSLAAIKPNEITGWVVGDSINADTFKVWLIKYDSSTQILSAVDSTICWNSITGFAPFTFTNPANGNYRLKAAQLDGPTSGTGKVPTYHVSSLYWNTATVFNHTNGSTPNKYIFLQTGTVTSGPGFIGGNVTLGANKGTAAGVEGLSIFLKDQQDNLVKYTTTDANGDYSFGSLPAGTYVVYPEDINYATTSATVVAAGQHTTVMGINFEQSPKHKTIKPVSTGINDDLKANSMFTVSPNPASGKVFIAWANTAKGNADVTVADVAGRIVYKSTVSTGSIAELNLAHLQSGQYFISVKNNNATASQQVVLQK